MITHEEVKQELKEQTDYTFIKLPKTYQYLNQQEKKDKLLELYRKAKQQVLDYVDTPNKTPKVLHLLLDIHETLDEIEALEEELK
jgi:hypothetical protein